MQLRIVNSLILTLSCVIAVACGAEGSTDVDVLKDSPKATRVKDAGIPRKDAAAKEDAEAPEDRDADVGPQLTPDQICAQHPSDECSNCCISVHAAGFAAYNNGITNCVCQPSVCQSACATTSCNSSNPQPPNTSCDTCYQNTGMDACAMAIQTACVSNADCVAMINCVSACGI